MSEHGLTIAALGPIVERDVHIRQDVHGRYRLRVMHRHHAGTWKDCEDSVYESLTRSELEDVLEQEMDALDVHPGRL